MLCGGVLRVQCPCTGSSLCISAGVAVAWLLFWCYSLPRLCGFEGAPVLCTPWPAGTAVLPYVGTVCTHAHMQSSVQVSIWELGQYLKSAHVVWRDVTQRRVSNRVGQLLPVSVDETWLLASADVNSQVSLYEMSPGSCDTFLLRW